MAKSHSNLTKALLTIWSIFAYILGKIFLAFPSQKHSHAYRKTIPHTQKGGILFFCSSAGEYEQAKPLMDRLQTAGQAVYIVFFSISGYSFAEKRKEKIPYYLSPIDTIWHWKKWFQQLQPTATILVRHELWPAFLFNAKHYGPVFLINATRVGGKRSWLKDCVKSKLLKFVTTIFVVEDLDAEYFKTLGVKKTYSLGDTKYDRVYDRKHNPSSTAQYLLHNLKNVFTHKKVLTIGSAWPTDLEMVLTASSQFSVPAQILCVPHQLTENNLIALESICTQHHKTFQRFSKNPTLSANTQIFILDKMGVLAEVYSISTAVMVGGGTHHQVHNVLEPAIHFLPLSFGQYYENSPEAISLVHNSLATVVRSSHELTHWWDNIHHHQPDRLAQHLHQWMGASDRILSHLIGQHYVQTNSSD